MRKPYYNLVLDILNEEGFLSQLLDAYNDQSPSTVFFINAHCYNVAQNNPEYRNAILNSDFVLNDGIGIKLGARFINLDLLENLNGTDLIPKIIEQAVNLNKKIYLLGGNEGVALKAAAKLKSKYPEIHIHGTHSGYFTGLAEQNLISEAGQAELLILGMGVPKQELWAFQHKHDLLNTKIIVAGGAILDFISENVKRAPSWVRKLHLEWVFRLVLEPGRLWKRYIIGNMAFLFSIVKYRLTKKS